MKKLLTGIAVFITMAVICVFSAGAETFGDFRYEILENGTVEITDYLGGAEKLTIPSQIDGKKVTVIGAYAFDECNSLVSVTIPASVTDIGNYAFYYCESLESVAISGNVTRIGNKAFGNCNALSSISIPESVTSIGDEAFLNCDSLVSITIPKNVRDIGEFAFYNCTALKSATICNGITYISNFAFADCSALESVTIPDSVTNIGVRAFYQCYSLKTVTIPDSVKVINNYAFIGCTSLTSITIPDSVTDIGVAAFCNCKSLATATIPDGVIRIGEDAFSQCGVLVIECFKGSCAEEYAISEEIRHKVITPYIAGFKLSSRNYNSITLSWNKRNNVTGYILQMYKNGAWVNLTNIKDNTITSYKVTDLTANTSYKFRAVAYVTKGGATNYSKYTSALTVSTAPAMTTGFAITGRGSDYLTLTWTKNAGASGYVIQEQINGTWTKVVAIKGNETTSYKIEGLEPNSFHRYRMVAYKTDANGTTYGKYTGSAPGYTAPAMVSNFKVSNIGADSLTVSWDKVESADGYVIDIYRDGKWSQLAKITSNVTTSYKASGLTLGTTYKFRIKSYATNGTLTINSTYSSAIAVTGSDFSVANLTVTNRGTDFISVKWDKNDKAEGYMVYIYDGSSWKCVKTLTSNSAVSHKITGLTSAKAYKVTVKAYKTVNGVRQVSGATPVSVTTL